MQGQNNPRILDYVSAVKSTRGVQDDEIDWASAFAEWSLNQVGIEGPQSMEPNDWLNWGRAITIPEQGCITVFSFKGLGHVGFFISEEGNSVNILGGNQSDVVKDLALCQERRHRLSPTEISRPVTVAMILSTGALDAVAASN